MYGMFARKIWNQLISTRIVPVLQYLYAKKENETFVNDRNDDDVDAFQNTHEQSFFVTINTAACMAAIII